jgi:hypothetical protein
MILPNLYTVKSSGHVAMNLISGERVDIFQESLLRVLKLRRIKQHYSTLKGVT